MRITFLIVTLCGLLPAVCPAQTRHGKAGTYASYQGRVMAGYQGWFRAPGDGSGNQWGHYGRDGKFDPEHNTIDFWPDVSEYTTTYATDFKEADGTPARVFSSLDESTTDLHFKWMADYGIDGVFMQRFFGVTRQHAQPDKPEDIILQHALEAAGKHDRALAVMYDLSGLRQRGEDCSSVMEDWKMLVDRLHVTRYGKRQQYLFHRGKPLVVIWGVGFPDRPYNLRDIGVNRLIDFLKNDPVYGGCSVMLGVPTYFRTLNKDCVPDPYLHELIASVDIVMPWMVQRFTPLLHNDKGRYADQVREDIAWCKARGVDYVPVVYPGFSWQNLALSSPGLAAHTAYGAIPRLRGSFFWDQIHAALTAGAPMLYVAMFDEVDEGTAIFKVSDRPPNSEKAHFMGNDGMPSDHYLYLTGQAARMLRREVPLTEAMPERSPPRQAP
ncbi:hypothetical protein SAMN05421823_11466 [Catalinimonas alkaloidigena]|uniref:Xylosidase n=1 Tax=Catalinimonas alkaloidigena TaxID=1075417 RepID=A0A1G9TN00_9BACT|nr:glycoside hydrolase family 71/99-like protein [Catalinimonas alkaloidigena]SDM49063.1 hypothetical protein SAMN05421823_11466 [Catalinimonas alkaloidigena]